MPIRVIRNGLEMLAAAGLALGLAACHGGSSSAAAPPADTVRISGTVTYDFVPTRIPGGLDYGATEIRPARGVTVEFVDGTTVLSTARTDMTGRYSFSVPANRTGRVRAVAEAFNFGTPAWFFQVVDNTSSDAIYTLDGAPLSSGAADSTRDLHAASGWTGSSYADDRAAAPFAILDAIYEAVQFLLATDPNLEFPDLDLHWSPDNRPTFDADGNVDETTGEIGTSFYQTGFGIYLLGEENGDSDEYDRDVIVHEFAHYLEAVFGRSDSIGGAHALTDFLDIRLAFSEGWGTSFAALALDDPDFTDTGGFQQSGTYRIDVESGGGFTPGYFSEASALQLIYDLVDTTADGADGVALPFAALWNVMTGYLVDTPALASIFPLLNGLRAGNAGDAVLIDQLAGRQDVTPGADDFGTTQVALTSSPDELPLYSTIAVNGPAVTDLCSTDAFSSGVTGGENKLGMTRFLRLTPPAAGNYTITVTAVDIPTGSYADPDFFVFRDGVPVGSSESAPTDACQAVDDPAWVPGNCVEAGVGTLQATEYVLEIYEWTNTNADDDPDFPPIGRTCFDVTVTQ